MNCNHFFFINQMPINQNSLCSNIARNSRLKAYMISRKDKILIFHQGVDPYNGLITVNYLLIIVQVKKRQDHNFDMDRSFMIEFFI